MPFLVAIPAFVMLVCLGLATGFLQADDISVGLGYPVVVSIAILVYAIARTPKGGW